MFGFGGSEIAIIALIVLLIFGARRLPEIGKGLGGAVREFRGIKKQLKGEDKPQGKQDGESEGGIADKVLDNVPGVKTAVQLKDKAEKISKLVG